MVSGPDVICLIPSYLNRNIWQGFAQPRFHGSLLPFPTEQERERRVGERTWERGWVLRMGKAPKTVSRDIVPFKKGLMNIP